MRDEQDVRWTQRLVNYALAFSRLDEAVQLAGQRPLSLLEQQGLIQAFDFTHELAWNLMKDYFFWQGNSAISGSRDAAREAFARGLVSDGEGWMAMIRSRNQTSHTYNQALAESIVAQIIESYFTLFRELLSEMQQRAAVSG